MSGNNTIFNVNGDLKNTKSLLDTLKLAFEQDNVKTVVGYRISETKGLILYKYDSDKCIKFPVPLDAEKTYPIVLAYLQSNPKCECIGWDANADHDGSNGEGWRVYCEDWGHIDNDWHAFLAIKPAFIWYGK